MKLPNFMKGHKFYKVEFLSDNYGDFEDGVEADENNANCVSSIAEEGTWWSRRHRPVIDLDMEAALIPSSTSGHYHLYIDKIMSEEHYHKLLAVMHEVGLIEKGYLNRFERCDMTFLRLPGVRK